MRCGWLDRNVPAGWMGVEFVELDHPDGVDLFRKPVCVQHDRKNGDEEGYGVRTRFKVIEWFAFVKEAK